jgi:hypothetical protein
MRSLSCRLSAAAIRFLAVLSRPGVPLPLRSAYRRWSVSPDLNGVSMFRTGEMRPVSGASSTPGSWCSRGLLFTSAITAASQRRTLFFGVTFHPPEVPVDEAYRGSPHSPFRPSLRR